MSTATVPQQTDTITDEKSPLTPELFLHHMGAMAVHYKTVDSKGAGPSHPYALPIALTHLVSSTGVMTPAAAPAGPAKAALDALLKTHQATTQAFAKKQHDFVNAQASKLQGNHDTASFAAAMNAQRAQAKAESDQNIDNLYNKLTALGTQHPELQSTVLSVASKIGTFFMGLLAGIAAFFTDIYNKIVGWIKSAVDWVKGAAATAAKWLAGAAGTITSFFSSIF